MYRKECTSPLEYVNNDATLMRCNGGGRTCFDLLCETEIHQLYMALGIDEEILGLHVSVRNALDIVQEFQYQDNLCGIEPSSVQVESACVSQISEDFSSRAVVELHQSVISRCTIRFLLSIADQHV